MEEKIKEAMEKFKGDFGKLRVRGKGTVIGGALTMTFIRLVNLSFSLHV